MVRCFKCHKVMEAAVRSDPGEEEEDTWEMPSGGVNLDGGNNYGSTIYDSLVDGIRIRVVICDDCLRDAGPELVRETQGEAG